MDRLSAKQLRAKKGDILVRDDEALKNPKYKSSLEASRFFEVEDITDTQLQIHGISSLGHMHFLIEIDPNWKCWVEIIRNENRFIKQKKVFNL